MCVRYVRTAAGASYVAPLSVKLFRPHDLGEIDSPTWNAGPGTRQLIIYPHGIVREINWGYRPLWCVAQQLPQVITVRAENVVYSPLLRVLWMSGRVIVPADSWYEWIGTDGGVRRPYAIRPKTAGPLFLAGMTNLPPGNAACDGDGFVIITTGARSGLFDVHGRRPLVFAEDAAREWLDPATSAEEADDLAHKAVLPADTFEWFPVGPAVNKIGNDGAELVSPI
jgi:putative SOS response-associated peptidase YedK